MSKLKFEDLKRVTELDATDLKEVVGGFKWWKTYSTEDIHRGMYGDESPYGRIPVSSKSSKSGYSSPYSFFSF